MSRIRANNIVNGAGTGAPTFPNGAIISGIATINADIDSNSNLTANQITSLQSIGVGTGATVTNPVDNELAFNTNGSERLRIDSSGNIGIGTDNPIMRLHVHGAANSVDSRIRLSSTEGSGLTIRAQSATENNINVDGGEFLSFTVGNTEGFRMNSSGNIAFASGNGIDFSAASGSAAGSTSALLDDYEEGTFTMTVSCGGNTADQQCRYTKIGRVVYIDGHGNSELSNYFNTGSQAAGTAVTITTNLPFTPVRTGAAPITVSRTLKGANGFEYERMFVGWRADSATIYLGSSGSNQYYPENNVVTQNAQTNKTLLFSGFFVIE